jgi:hypothetical protein
VLKLLEDAEWKAWSSNEIAKRCAVSDHLVERIKSELHTSKNRSMPAASEAAKPEQTRTYTHPKTGKPTQMKTGAKRRRAAARLIRDAWAAEPRNCFGNCRLNYGANAGRLPCTFTHTGTNNTPDTSI